MIVRASVGEQAEGQPERNAGAAGRIDLITFPGAPNLPVFAALERGDFLDNGVDVRLETTPSSSYQMENLVKGVFQIAVESLGAADLAAFMGAAPPR